MLSRSEIRELAANADRTVAPAGRRLVAEGGQGRECFVVATGELQVRRRGETIAEVGPGSVVGEVALLDNAARNADVHALTDVELAVFDIRSVRGTLTSNARFKTMVEQAAEGHRV